MTTLHYNAAAMTTVVLQQITKKFGQTTALDAIDLRIEAGELFFLLGPSGCGKSTLLRLIAGLHEPTKGKIYFNDRNVTALGTEKRNAVMCFQSYALWPHMTVRENVGFGLEVRKVSGANQRVDEVLGLVQMDQYADRKPNQLSGGQQQRVALARALAVQPSCLLLDEPLSNLDAKLRIEMRSEIRRICKTAGFTTIYVTHDQKEALSIADRIAVLSQGKLAQVGTPVELYNSPASRFVADFLGLTNLIEGTVLGRDGDYWRIETSLGILVAVAKGDELPRTVTLSIRPELLYPARPTASSARLNYVDGKPVQTTFSGESSEHVIQVASQRLLMISMPPIRDLPGQLSLEFAADDVVVLTK